MRKTEKQWSMYTTFTIEEKGRAWEELRRAEKLYTKNHKYCILLEIAGHKKVLVLLCNYPFSKIEDFFDQFLHGDICSIRNQHFLGYLDHILICKRFSTFSSIYGLYLNIQEVWYLPWVRNLDNPASSFAHIFLQL